jgi:hypothetical protein
MVLKKAIKQEDEYYPEIAVHRQDQKAIAQLHKAWNDETPVAPEQGILGKGL